MLEPVIKSHVVTLSECPRRWLMHQGLLVPVGRRDAVLIGIDNVARLENGLVNLEESPPLDNIVKALEDG